VSDGHFDALTGGGDDDSPAADCPSCGEEAAFSVVVHAAPGTQFPDDPAPTHDRERRREMNCCTDCGTVYDPTLAARE
jgi:uncharacterized Zn finger protein